MAARALEQAQRRGAAVAEAGASVPAGRGGGSHRGQEQEYRSWRRRRRRLISSCPGLADAHDGRASRGQRSWRRRAERAASERALVVGVVVGGCFVEEVGREVDRSTMAMYSQSMRKLEPIRPTTRTKYSTCLTSNTASILCSPGRLATVPPSSVPGAWPRRETPHTGHRQPSCSPVASFCLPRHHVVAALAPS